MHSVGTPALRTGLMDMTDATQHPQASVISAALAWGVPAAIVLLPAPRPLLLPSVPSRPPRGRQRAMSALGRWLWQQLRLPGAPAVSTSVTLSLYRALLRFLWVFGDWAGRCSVVAVCKAPSPSWLPEFGGVGQLLVSPPFLDFLCLQAKLLVQTCLKSRMTTVYGTGLPIKDWCGGFPYGLWSQPLWFVPFISWAILPMRLHPFGP